MPVKPLQIGVGYTTGAHTHQEGELEHEDRYVHVQKGNFTFVVILVIFAALKSSNFFLWKIWDIRNTKTAANMNW